MKVTKYALRGKDGTKAERYLFIITESSKKHPSDGMLGGADLKDAEKLRQFLLKLPWGTVKALMESHPFAQLVPKR